MKNNPNFKEILLLHSSRFMLRCWFTQKDDLEQKFSEATDQLKAACWNGLVPEILPECFETKNNQAGYLWEVIESRSFIGLNYSNTLPVKENTFSIDPHVFMTVQHFN